MSRNSGTLLLHFMTLLLHFMTLLLHFIDKAECINSVFASKSHTSNPFRYVAPSYPLYNVMLCTHSIMYNVSFSPKKEEKVLSGLDPASALVPGGIGAIILRF